MIILVYHMYTSTCIIQHTIMYMHNVNRHMYVHVHVDLTDLHVGLGKVTGVWGDGSIGAASIGQRELVQRYTLVLVHFFGGLDGRGTFPGRASAAS